ncbi:MAG: hypothetical protein ACUVS7_16645 [Bryobacteraceae bacterium]
MVELAAPQRRQGEPGEATRSGGVCEAFLLVGVASSMVGWLKRGLWEQREWPGRSF